MLVIKSFVDFDSLHQFCGRFFCSMKTQPNASLGEQRHKKTTFLHSQWMNTIHINMATWKKIGNEIKMSRYVIKCYRYMVCACWRWRECINGPIDFNLRHFFEHHILFDRCKELVISSHFDFIFLICPFSILHISFFFFLDYCFWSILFHLLWYMKFSSMAFE